MGGRVTYITPHVQLYTTMYVPCSTSEDILTVYFSLLACLMSCISHPSIHSIIPGNSTSILLVPYRYAYPHYSIESITLILSQIDPCLPQKVLNLIQSDMQMSQFIPTNYSFTNTSNSHRSNNSSWAYFIIISLPCHSCSYKPTQLFATSDHYDGCKKQSYLLWNEIQELRQSVGLKWQRYRRWQRAGLVYN